MQNESLRVLHIINGEHFSGAERVQDLLGLTLSRFGWQPGFVCLKDGKFPKQRESTDCPLYIEPMNNRFDLRIVRAIVRIVKSEGYRIVHAHTPRSVMIGRLVARKTGAKLVYHVHSPVGRDSTRFLQNKLNQWTEQWSLRKCDAMICVSKSLKSYMEHAGHDPGKLFVVHNGVRSLASCPDRNPPMGTWTLGTTALFRPRKGTEVLLQAIANLRNRGCPVRLLAVGPFESTDYEQKIKSLATELEISSLIEWTGFQTDVNAFFQRMDLFVLPSLFGEGLPMVVLEAMATGVPVIAADVEGVNEAIRDQIDGHIFPPGDSTALADSIQTLIERPDAWKQMSHSCVIQQSESFSETSMAAGVASVYRTICEMSPGNSDSHSTHHN
ncbi:MAG TPA: glycosyltransferase [Pirellulaceae bacterium]|nr:glycosyltransferase [Pirellulaceae bacterium]HMO90851.1 glycosyltransferase [Pirellulaceae bacterium]HMP68673.1 glycosyltransferase [Pirellulaceae bacterium]